MKASGLPLFLELCYAGIFICSFLTLELSPLLSERKGKRGSEVERGRYMIRREDNEGNILEEENGAAEKLIDGRM